MMQRAVAGLELSVNNVDKKINQMEWKICEVSKVAMNLDPDSDTNFLKLLSTISKVKKDYEKIIKDHEKISEQLDKTNKSFQDVFESLEKRYMCVYDKMSDIN